jgi:hypothetical protein
MAGKKIRIGVAGLGRIGWKRHCTELAAPRDYALVAVRRAFDFVTFLIGEARVTQEGVGGGVS